MSDDVYDRRDTWKPKPRPEWLARLNAEGDALDAKTVVPLDEASLMRDAMAKTGLSDFGDDEWLPHFRVLLRAVENEAKLNFFGRILTRSDFILYLEQRLTITDWYNRHPEIDDEIIHEPVFIVGFGRSGTTILHEVLSQDPQFRVVKRWEASYPCPPPEEATYETDPRIKKAHDRITLLNRVTPEMVAMHPFSGDLPVEDAEFTYCCFLAEVFFYAFQIPTYEKYQSSQPVEYMLRWHKKYLKLLQWRYKKPHWLLKWPTIFPKIPDLLKAYPDAKILIPHRDPVTSNDSVVNVMGTMFYWRTDDPFSGGVLDEWLTADGRIAVLDNLISWIETGTLKPGSFANVLYRDFMEDPIPTLKKAYKDMGLTGSDEGFARMKAYLDKKPKHAAGVHKYKTTAEDEALISAERQVYAHYQKYFGVPNE